MSAVVVLTPNPAIDVTYQVDRQAVGETVRVRDVRRRPGGKGLNVVGVLRALGHAPVAIQPIAGESGRWLAERLASCGVRQVGVAVVGETRTTVAVVGGDAHPTLYAESGPRLTGEDWDRVVAAVETACEPGGVLVVSGSFPPATPPSAVAALVAAAHRAGSRVVVDTGGAQLLQAADAGADVLKPNAREAAEATGTDDAAGAADELRRRSGGAVVVTCGVDGLLGVAADGSRVAQPSVPGVRGNPVGAGDAATAGLVAALSGGAELPEAMSWAAVVGAAAVLRPVAGQVDPADLPRLAGRLPERAAPRQPFPPLPRRREGAPAGHGSDLVRQARHAGRGLGAFNVVLLEHAEAIVAGAERAALPVILQISQNCVAYHGAFEPIGLASLAVARRASVPVVVHLDHAEDVDLVHEAVEAGVTSVMYDGSRLPYEQNVATTRAVVEYCHARGVVVEAELGEVGGKDGVHAPGARTDPVEAAAFVAATGVDSLAVAVGTSHAMTERVATVDADLIGALAGALDMPLVLHGSSGLSDDELRRAVRAGMTKVNISTHLNALFTAAVRDGLRTDRPPVDPRTYVAAGREVVAAEVERLLRLLAGA